MLRRPRARRTDQGAVRPGAGRVVLVTGKGGVGKTSVASALALARARAGERVLVVSTDPAHNLADVWDADVGPVATRVHTADAGTVDALEIDPQATVDAHLEVVGATMRRLLPEHLHRQVERHLALAREAPGTHESAVLERIAQVAEEGTVEVDLVLFDTAPSGHTLRLMSLPGQLTVWTESLLVNRDRADRFGDALASLGGGEEESGGVRGERAAELRDVLERRRARFASLRDRLADPGRRALV